MPCDSLSQLCHFTATRKHSILNTLMFSLMALCCASNPILLMFHMFRLDEYATYTSTALHFLANNTEALILAVNF